MCMEQLQVLNVHGAVACGEMCMVQEQLHVVNVHGPGAVACGEMCMEQLHVHVIRMSPTEFMTLKIYSCTSQR